MDTPEALALLRDALRQMQSEGARPVAAAVKNRLLRLTDRTFSEVELGFPTFRAFLQHAEAERVVSVAPTAGGDVEVLLPGQPGLPGGPRRMRRDFWNAFIKWDDGRVRLYDRDADRVLFVDASAGENLTAVAAHRYVPIPAPAREDTVRAMQEFLERVPADARPGLEAILAGTDGVEKKFIDALPPSAKAAWRSTAAWQAMSRAEAWRADNGLDVELHVAPAASYRAPAEAPTGTRGAHHRDEAIRRRVVAAVERMPMSAVLQLTIPVEYLLDDGPL